MEKKMENDMESEVIKGLSRDPSIQKIPTLGPKVCKYDLHWAIRIFGEFPTPVLNCVGHGAWAEHFVLYDNHFS